MQQAKLDPLHVWWSYSMETRARVPKQWLQGSVPQPAGCGHFYLSGSKFLFCKMRELGERLCEMLQIL